MELSRGMKLTGLAAWSELCQAVCGEVLVCWPSFVCWWVISFDIGDLIHHISQDDVSHVVSHSPKAAENQLGQTAQKWRSDGSRRQFETNQNWTIPLE